MKARLLKDQSGNVKLLYSNGSISNSSTTVLANFLLNFKDATRMSGNDGDWTSYRDMSLYPGDTLAYVTDDLVLVIEDFVAFEPLLKETYSTQSYITLFEYAEKVNKSCEIIKVWCRQGRIAGAQKMAGRWMVPKDAPYPVPPERQKPGSGKKKNTEN